MNKSIILIVLLLSLTACSSEIPKQGSQILIPPSIFVLFENGGTVPEKDQEAARDTAFHLLHQLTDLRRRKATRNTQIQIILSALPNRIAWSGTPKQLLEQKDDIKALLSFKQTFSDLVMAYEEIETNIKLTQPNDVKLYWIGPTIHVPFQPLMRKLR